MNQKQLFVLIYQFAKLYHNCNNNYQTQMSKELYYSITGDLISLKIQIKEARSLIMQAPLNWQINKIKCLLVNKFPALNFERFHLAHDNIQLPGTCTLLDTIEFDHIENCRYTLEYHLTVITNEKETNQFSNYYSQKIVQFLSPVHGTPFQPLLNQRYSLMIQILEVKDSQNIKSISKIRKQMIRLTNFKQIREEMLNQANRLNREAAELRQERLQGRQDHNRGMQMIVMRAFTTLQMFCLGYILGVILTYMRLQHYAVIGVILLLIGLIQIMRKSNQRPQEQLVHPAVQQQKPQIQTGNDSNKDIQLQQIQHRNNKQQQTMWIRLCLTVKIWLILKTCLLVEVLISFMLSLFPNWTMQTHLNFFRATHFKIQRAINSWRFSISKQGPTFVDDGLKDNHAE